MQDLVDTYLKDLDVPHGFLGASRLVHLRPFLDDTLYVRDRQSRKGQVMSRMKDYYIAASRNRLRLKQVMRNRRSCRTRWRQDRSVIILEDHSMLINRILLPSCASVARTKIAFRVVLWEL